LLSDDFKHAPRSGATMFNIQTCRLKFIKFILQAGRLRVRFPMVLLEFFIDLILPTGL